MHTIVYAPFWRRLLAGAFVAAAPLLGWSQQAAPPAQADPPARVAYISALEGAAQIAAADASDWTPAALNWPVTTGTHIATDPGARVELHGGTIVLRLSGPSSLDVTLLDDLTTQVALTEGALSVRVRELQSGERVEIDTPQLAVIASQPGEYRLDVDPGSHTTRVAVYAGVATVYGETGQSTTIAERQQATFSDRTLAVVQRGGASPRDPLDQWAAARDAAEDGSPSARYVSRDTPGYQLLDNYGQWAQDPGYGAVWYPTVSDADWAPYRHGRWTWVDPWGWSWVDDAPWGFAPSHYGRWARIGVRWAWVPGPMVRRPVYAPALVGFMGGNRWGMSVGAGLPAAGWFPLAPGEYWHPGYHASDRYRRRVNQWGHGPVPLRPPAGGYRFQHRPEAVSVAFGGGAHGTLPRRFGDGRQLPSGALNQAHIVQPSPRSNFSPGAAAAPGRFPPPRANLSRPPNVRAPGGGGAFSSHPPGAAANPRVPGITPGGNRPQAPRANSPFVRPGGMGAGSNRLPRDRPLQPQRPPSVARPAQKPFQLGPQTQTRPQTTIPRIQGERLGNRSGMERPAQRQFERQPLPQRQFERQPMPQQPSRVMPQAHPSPQFERSQPAATPAIPRGSFEQRGGGGTGVRGERR